MGRARVVLAHSAWLLLLSCSRDTQAPTSATNSEPTLRLLLVSGDTQSTTPAKPLPRPIVVQALLGSRPSAGVKVSFSISPSGTLEPTTATTDSTGIATTIVSPGTSAGTYTIVAAASGASQITTTARVVVPVEPLSPSLIAAGGAHTCALRSTGTVFCWGDNTFGQLGTGDTIGRSQPAQVIATAQFTKVAAGTWNTCAQTTSGDTYCWGRGNIEVLGDGTNATQAQPLPQKVISPVPFTSVVVMSFGACGLVGSGDVYCWGLLGKFRPTAQLVAAPVKFVSLVGAELFPCALTAAGVAYCLAQGDQSTINITGAWTQVAGTTTFIALTAGTSHVCGLTATSDAYCWGANESGQLGDGTKAAQGQPVHAAAPFKFKSLSAGGSHTCAISLDDSTYCWGKLIGDGGTSSTFPFAVLVQSPQALVSLSAGHGHTCGITATQSLFCWGDNSAGELGDSTFISRTTPVAVSGVDRRLRLGALGSANWVVDASDTVVFERPTIVVRDGAGNPVAGAKVSFTVTGGGGSIGSGTQTTDSNGIASIADWRIRPGVNTLSAAVSGAVRDTVIFVATAIQPYKATQLVAGTGHFCALRADSTAACWGFGGELGDGSTASSTDPVAVSGAHKFIQLASAWDRTCGLTLSTDVWCWDRNYLEPVLLLPASALRSISVSIGAICGLTDNGQARCAGANNYGQLGNQNYDVSRASLDSIDGGFRFESISGGGEQFCGVTSGSHTAFCWGGTEVHSALIVTRAFPQQIQNSVAVSQLSTGDQACGVGMNHNGYCWGLLYGDDASAHYFDAVAVTGSLSFANINVDTDYMCGVTTTQVGYCWGRSNSYNLGDGSPSALIRPFPSAVQGPWKYSMIQPSSFFGRTCAVRADGAIYCWGGLKYQTVSGNGFVGGVPADWPEPMASGALPQQTARWRIPNTRSFRSGAPRRSIRQ